MFAIDGFTLKISNSVYYRDLTKDRIENWSTLLRILTYSTHHLIHWTPTIIILLFHKGSRLTSIIDSPWVVKTIVTHLTTNWSWIGPTTRPLWTLINLLGRSDWPRTTVQTSPTNPYRSVDHQLNQKPQQWPISTPSHPLYYRQQQHWTHCRRFHSLFCASRLAESPESKTIDRYHR